MAFIGTHSVFTAAVAFGFSILVMLASWTTAGCPGGGCSTGDWPGPDMVCRKGKSCWPNGLTKNSKAILISNGSCPTCSMLHLVNWWCNLESAGLSGTARPHWKSCYSCAWVGHNILACIIMNIKRWQYAVESSMKELQNSSLYYMN